jgi:outer membrane biosynthesis protein TonB
VSQLSPSQVPSPSPSPKKKSQSPSPKAQVKPKSQVKAKSKVPSPSQKPKSSPSPSQAQAQVKSPSPSQKPKPKAQARKRKKPRRKTSNRTIVGYRGAMRVFLSRAAMEKISRRRDCDGGVRSSLQSVLAPLGRRVSSEWRNLASRFGSFCQPCLRKFLTFEIRNLGRRRER